MAPSYPKRVLEQLTDEELRKTANFIAYQRTGDTRLGTITPGQKTLIVTDSTQDMRLLNAVIKGMKHRGVDVDYIFEKDLLKEAMGITGEVPLQKILRDINWEAGYTDAIWPRLLPDNLRKTLVEVEDRWRIGAKESSQKSALQEAIRRYVYELYPEYDAVVGGRPRQIYMQITVGSKWNSLWKYTNVREVLTSAAMYPADVWRLTEDKIMQLMPWIEEVHITDPEGTDLHFSVTAEEAEIWPKAAYLPNHLFLYPLQGGRDLYFLEGSRQVLLPKANGVIAATGSHVGVFSHLKVYVEDGVVTHVEGSGPYKNIWDAYLSNEKLSNARIPYLPKQGFLYLFEISAGANPKAVRDFRRGFYQDARRSGVFHWGFGMESTIPEIQQYMKDRGLPNDHGLHMMTHFSTYEVKLRGRNDWIKIVDKGHMTALGDPEVRALATRYGDPDEILGEDWIPDKPGINVPGNYMEDFGKDPLPYIQKQAEGLENGTYAFFK